MNMNQRSPVSATINKGFLIFHFSMKLTFESVMLSVMHVTCMH